MIKGQQSRISRRLAREARERDESKPVADMSYNELWASVYRLQARRNPRLSDRIRELETERIRRREATKDDPSVIA